MTNVARVIQDRISQEGTRVKHFVQLEATPFCVSTNKDCSQILAAGRSVFKIFNIEEDHFSEKVNLRQVRNLNLTYSASDASWSHGDGHILASASINGAVVLWNINGRSRQEHIFKAYERPATRVNFHKFEHHLLISGSLDGYMKLFDLRKRDVSSSFHHTSSAVRDVQFNPHQYFQFAAAFDSGNVQLWDIRYPTRVEREFTAHIETCFSIDWHPEDSSWLASAGRDKIIKVWDIQSNKSKNLHQIQTIASVSQIKWRPQRKHHIASCSFNTDCSVNVWDIHRPYIPFASFEEHSDVVTGIAWRNADPHIFYSVGRDCTMYQHLFKDAVRPADRANPVSVALSALGNVGLATNDKLLTGVTKGFSARLPFFRRGPDRKEQFTKETSVCNEFEGVPELSPQWLLVSACEYQLSGRPLTELCDHNANIAKRLGRHEICQTWRMLQTIYGSSPHLSATGLKQDNKDSEHDKAKADKATSSQDAKNQDEGDPKDAHHGDTSTGVSEEESDAQDPESDHPKTSNLATIASGLGNTSHSDFFFGDGTADQGMFDYDNLVNITNGQDWNLPSEAFQPRQDFTERPSSPDPLAAQGGAPAMDSTSSNNDSEFSMSANQLLVPENLSIKQEILSCPPFHSSTPTGQFNTLVSDMLHQYAEKGDVQMCVAVLIILGDKIKPHIDETVQEQWLMSYIDLLSHYQLWCQATEVMKLCNHHRVSQENQKSTHIHTNCSKCSKPLLRGGWLCDRCSGYINTCSICHHPVKGLYAWCQGCSHGGHLQHIQEWLVNHKQCPAGCGHLCEYST